MMMTLDQFEFGIVGPGYLNPEQALATIVPVEARIGREISVRIYSAEDFRTRREQGEHFINNVMTGTISARRVIVALDSWMVACMRWFSWKPSRVSV